MGHLMELNEGEKINISKIAKQLKIHRQTLSSWLKKVSIDNTFNPKVNYSNAHLSMTPELEEQILFEIEENFLSPGYFFNNHIMKIIAKAAWDAADDSLKKRKKFCASDKWCRNFRKIIMYNLNVYIQFDLCGCKYS